MFAVIVMWHTTDFHSNSQTFTDFINLGKKYKCNHNSQGTFKDLEQVINKTTHFFWTLLDNKTRYTAGWKILTLMYHTAPGLYRTRKRKLYSSNRLSKSLLIKCLSNLIFTRQIVLIVILQINQLIAFQWNGSPFLFQQVSKMGRLPLTDFSFF